MTTDFQFNVDKSLAGRTVAITGGAGGLGMSTARAFLQSGAKVVLIDVDADRLEVARHELDSSRVVFHASRLDSPEACAHALAQAGGTVFALVHLAGIVERDFFDPAQRGIWDRSIAANLTTAYDMSVAFLRQADTADGVPRIVLTSSMAYRRGGIGGASYSAAKGGVAGLMRSLSRQLAPGILVNALAPGVIETPMTVEMRRTRHDELVREIPLQRFGQPHEVAAVIHFLCGSGATFITGQVINVDGGQVNS
jgi:3-oxoacyl-[acyl-carrier protein] reductase